MRAKKHVLIAISILIIISVLALTSMKKQMAPEIEFASLDGKRVVLSSLRGKVVLVNFWATSCPGCIKEMPLLAKAYHEYQVRGLEIVAVAMSYDPPEYVRNYVQRRKLPFTVALDTTGEAARAFNQVKLTPTTFVIDKQGHIIQQILGELDSAQLKILLEQHLGGAAS